MNVNVVIFDLDGTLVNTIPAISYAFNKVLSKYNFNTFDIEEYKHFIGNGFPTVYDKINEILNLNIDKEKFLFEVREVYDKNFLEGIKLYEGIGKLLDYLTKKGKILAIATNKDQNLAEKHANTILSKWKFEYIFGNSVNNKYPRKPDPYIINEILRNHSKDEAVLRGDMIVDKKTAENAGIKHIHCKYGYETKEIQVDISVDKADEIIEVII